jgi:hypothetical protein
MADVEANQINTYKAEYAQMFMIQLQVYKVKVNTPLSVLAISG